MCGLTLLPRKTLPINSCVSISMKLMSLESRLTISTTLVGSGILMSPDAAFAAGMGICGIGACWACGVPPIAHSDKTAMSPAPVKFLLRVFM